MRPIGPSSFPELPGLPGLGGGSPLSSPAWSDTDRGYDPPQRPSGREVVEGLQNSLDRVDRSLCATQEMLRRAVRGPQGNQYSQSEFQSELAHIEEELFTPKAPPGVVTEDMLANFANVMDNKIEQIMNVLKPLMEPSQPEQPQPVAEAPAEVEGDTA